MTVHHVLNLLMGDIMIALCNKRVLILFFFLVVTPAFSQSLSLQSLNNNDDHGLMIGWNEKEFDEWLGKKDVYCLRFFRPLPKTRLCCNTISLCVSTNVV